MLSIKGINFTLIFWPFIPPPLLLRNKELGPAFCGVGFDMFYAAILLYTVLIGYSNLGYSGAAYSDLNPRDEPPLVLK